jgi:hypothetical protein
LILRNKFILIDLKTNVNRKDDDITDKYINEHKLQYFNYPNPNEYHRVIKNKFINSNEYNNICEKRENEYFNQIIATLNI